MNSTKLYEKFLGNTVNIGIPHLYQKRKLFYLTGLVIDIEGDFLVLKIKNGLRKIPFDDIMEIQLNLEDVSNV